MKRITVETHGPAVHAAWVALNEKVVRTMRKHRADPVAAWIIGEGPRPAHIPDPHARNDESEAVGTGQPEAAAER